MRWVVVTVAIAVFTALVFIIWLERNGPRL